MTGMWRILIPRMWLLRCWRITKRRSSMTMILYAHLSSSRQRRR
ncbi:hypothetical protein LINGRAHAP2_LOCUS8039 [Linum grandiflorum]